MLKAFFSGCCATAVAYTPAVVWITLLIVGSASAATWGWATLIIWVLSFITTFFILKALGGGRKVAQTARDSWNRHTTAHDVG